MWWKIVLIVLASLIVLALLLIQIDNMLFNQKVNTDLKALEERVIESGKGLITEKDIESLPEPVQRYLRYTGIIGKSRINTVQIIQKGYIRQTPDQSWMSLEAEQYFITGSPGFVWKANMRRLPGVSIKARDMYLDGMGSMYIKLPPFITIADASGDEIDQGSALRYLAEMVWFPTAYLSDDIEWEPIDNDSCKIMMEHQDMTVSAVLHFNEKGEMVSITAERYREINGRYSLDKWAPRMSAYKEINGIKIPTRSEVIWKLDSGDFKAIEIEVTDIQYDNPTM